MTLPQTFARSPASVDGVVPDPVQVTAAAEPNHGRDQYYRIDGQEMGDYRARHHRVFLVQGERREAVHLRGSVDTSSGLVIGQDARVQASSKPFGIRTISGDIDLKACTIYGAVLSRRGAITVEGGEGQGHKSFFMHGTRNAQGPVTLRHGVDVAGELCARWVDMAGDVLADKLVVNAAVPGSLEPWAWVSLAGPCTVSAWNFSGPTSLVLDRVARARLPDDLPRHVELLDTDCPPDDAELARRLQLPSAQAPYSSYRWGRLQYVLSLVGDSDGPGRPTDVTEASPDKAREAHAQGAALLWQWLDSAPDQVAGAFERLDAKAMRRTIDVLRKAAVSHGAAPASDAQARALAEMRALAAVHGLHDPAVWLPGRLVHAGASGARWVLPGQDLLAAQCAARRQGAGSDRDFAQARREFAACVVSAGRRADVSTSRLAEVAQALTQLESPAFLDHLAAESPDVAETWEQEWTTGADQLAALLWRWLDTSPLALLKACGSLDLRSLDAVVSALCRHALRPNGGGEIATSQSTLALIAALAERRGLPEWQRWVDLFRSPVDPDTPISRAWKNEDSTEPSAPLPQDIGALRALLATPDPGKTALSDESWSRVQSLLGLMSSDALVRACRPQGLEGAALVRGTFHQMAGLILDWMQEEPKEFLRRSQALDRASIERMAALVCIAAIGEGLSGEGSPFFRTLDDFAALARVKNRRAGRIQQLLHRAEARNGAGESWDQSAPRNGVAWDSDRGRVPMVYEHIAIALGVREPLTRGGVSA